MDSPMSSAIALSGPPSTVSDFESVVDVNPGSQDKGAGSAGYPTSEENLDVGREAIVPEYDGKPLFDSGDGDIKLWVNGVCFETHKYLLKRFNRLKSLPFKRLACTELHLSPNGYEAEDFGRALKVLYASILEGPFEFDNPTLLSALRVATEYEYPALRTYAIQHLEEVELTAIERIKIAREFGLAAWEEPAYLELCERDEAITMEEANVLGMDAFVRVAGIREKEQRRRGREVDAQAKVPEDGCSTLAESPSNVVGSDDVQGSGSASEETAIGSTRSDGTTGTEIKPNFINMPLGHEYSLKEWDIYCGQHLQVPGCTCQFEAGYGHSGSPCAISPCIAMALKNLQTQQLAHTSDIASLKASTHKPPLAPNSDPTSTPPTLPTTRLSTREEVRLMVQALRELHVAA